MENIQKPLWKTQTIYGSSARVRRSPGRPPKVAPARVGGAAAAAPVGAGVRVQPLRGLHPVRALLREWLLELKVMGRSQRTIDWYAQKMDWYRRSGGAENLEELNAFELKRFLAEQQERGLSDNTIHGFFQVIRSFANWCEREEYPVDRSVLRMRPPKVALKEMSTYTHEQVALIFDNAKVGWPQLAVKVLLGTGIRVGELVNLLLEDVEDDEDASEVPPGAGLSAPAPGDHPLHQPEPAGQRGAEPAAASRRPAGVDPGGLRPSAAATAPSRLPAPCPPVQAHLRDRVPEAGRGDGTPAPHLGPHHLLDGHALRAPRQERPGPRLRPALPLLRFG